MARVTLEQVGKTYAGGVVAVQQADLVVNDQEFIVLVGPSGCGKSTTLRMIAGLESITHGNIRIGDRVVNEVPPKDRDIAMVFQNYALYPHLTVYENMAFGLRLRRQPHEEIDRRVQEASEILGLGDLLKRRPRELSGGQRQRVAVGRAIVRKPAVFLFDEPLSNLDAKMRVQMRMEIARLHRHLAATMIYVTHDQVEAMTLGDRIVVMKDGVIQQVAAPMELYQRPANTFVAGFIGSPPMNMLRGTLGLCDGLPVLEAEGVRLALDPACVAHLSNTIPGPIVLGLRPESVLLVPSGAPGALPAKIELAEPMGSETHLHLHAGAWSFIARAPASAVVTPGEACAVRLDLKQARFFDTASGRSLD